MVLTLPCTTCAPNAPVSVSGDEIRCLSCGTLRSFVRQPLRLITGVPGTGKSTIVPMLAGRLPDTAVMDTDLFGPWSNPDWEAWANSWLLLVHALAQSGLRSVLVGYGITKGNVGSLAAKELIGPVRVLNLHLDPRVLRERLQCRADYDPGRIERKVAAAEGFRQDADVNVDVTNMSPQHVAHCVLAWMAHDSQ